MLDFIPTPHKVQQQVYIAGALKTRTQSYFFVFSSSNLSRLRSRADNYLDIYESGYFYYAWQEIKEGITIATSFSPEFLSRICSGLRNI